MGSSSSKLDSSVTMNKFTPLAEELETITTTHTNTKHVEEIVSKKIDIGMHIKNKKSEKVLAVNEEEEVVLEEESNAIGQGWDWDGLRNNLKNRAHNGVLEVVDGTKLAIKERNTFCRMQEWRKEGSFLSCDMFCNRVLETSLTDGKPTYRSRHGGMNQQWEITKYSHWDIFVIQNKATKKFLGVVESSGHPVLKMELKMTSWKTKSGVVWSWQGINQFKNESTGLVLDFLKKNKVGVEESHGGTNQQWMYNKKDQIMCREGRKVVDLDAWGKVVMSKPHADPNQMWNLIPVTRIKAASAGQAYPSRMPNKVATEPAPHSPVRKNLVHSSDNISIIGRRPIQVLETWGNH